MPGTKDELRQLALKYLNGKWLAEINLHIDQGRLTMAQAGILGAIDARWSIGSISREEAIESFEKIGLSIEKAAEFRAVYEDPTPKHTRH